MRILAIDPGTIESGWVLYDTDAEAPVEAGITRNDRLLVLMWDHLESSHLVCEMIASYGMPVGASVFETCCWIGRFEASWSLMPKGRMSGTEFPFTHRVYRKDVKFHLCGSMKAKDGNIRQALIDRFSAGQGKRVAIGLKKTPGPLYGFKSHMWAALAVAVTWADKEASQR